MADDQRDFDRAGMADFFYDDFYNEPDEDGPYILDEKTGEIVPNPGYVNPYDPGLE